MKRWSVLSGSFLTTVLLTAELALGQQPQPADCKAKAPDQVEGQVVSVDVNQGKVTVREKDGTTHVFTASRETLQGMKPGDQVEAKLREAPKC